MQRLPLLKRARFAALVEYVLHALERQIERAVQLQELDGLRSTDKLAAHREAQGAAAHVLLRHGKALGRRAKLLPGDDMNLTVVDRLGIEPADEAGRHVREQNVLAPDRVLREDLAFEHGHAA